MPKWAAAEHALGNDRAPAGAHLYVATMARILLIRHGPSAHPTMPGLLDSAAVEQWRAAYDAAGPARCLTNRAAAGPAIRIRCSKSRRHMATHYCLMSWLPRTAMAFASAVTIATVACASDAIVSVPPDSQNRTIQVAVGQEIHVTLGNVGPAEYESPPQISSPAISFLGVDVVPPFTPAGPTQQFRFKAVQRGVAAIHFRRLLDGSVVYTVDDTVVVR